MKRRFLILVAVVAVASEAVSDDYVDDVYYWPDANSVSSSPSRDASETQATEYNQPNGPTITFIEDSITQRSDTVVKAVIRR